MCFSEKNLKEFQSEHLDFYKAIVEDVNAAKQIVAQNPEEVEKELAKTVKGNSKYRQRIAELAENKIDARNMIIGVLTNIEARVADLYDGMTAGQPSKADYIIIQLLNAMSPYFEKYFKFVEEKPDQVVQHNISIEYADKRFGMLQEAIREALSELDLEVSLQFIPKLQEKLAKLQIKEGANNNELTLADTKELNEDFQKIIGNNNA
jgi:hypothetical protein